MITVTGSVTHGARSGEEASGSSPRRRWLRGARGGGAAAGRRAPRRGRGAARSRRPARGPRPRAAPPRSRRGGGAPRTGAARPPAVQSSRTVILKRWKENGVHSKRAGGREQGRTRGEGELPLRQPRRRRSGGDPGSASARGAGGGRRGGARPWRSGARRGAQPRRRAPAWCPSPWPMLLLRLACAPRAWARGFWKGFGQQEQDSKTKICLFVLKKPKYACLRHICSNDFPLK